MKKATFVPVLTSLFFLLFIESANSTNVSPQPYNAASTAINKTLNLNSFNSVVKNSSVPVAQTATNDLNYVWLNLTGANGLFCQMAFGYRPEATDGVDDYDSTRIDGQFTLNSLIDSSASDYVIQSRSLPFSVSDIVKLSFKTPVAGNYTITVNQTMGLFSEGQDVIITDRVTGTVHNLSTGSYTFYSNPGYYTDRFSIVYQNAIASVILSNISNAFNNDVVVYKKKTEIHVSAKSNLINKVSVIDMNGRIVTEQNNINQNYIALPIAAVNQMLIVKTVLEDGQIITTKVL
jgi:hypothetical protein